VGRTLALSPCASLGWLVALALGGGELVPRSATSPPERLHFAVTPGTTLDKRFETSFHMRVEDLLAASESGVEGATPSYPQATDVATHELLRVTDRYGECAPSGPLGIERAYLEWKLDDTTGEIAGPEGVGALLAGCTVRFERGQQESWRREAVTLTDRAREEGVMLEKLAPELDFAVLLPAGEVSPGDAWEVPLERVDSLATPGLDAVRALGLETTSLLASLGELPAGEPAPALVCTYKASARAGDHQLATILLALEYGATLSPSHDAREDLARQISGGASLAVESFTHELSLVVTGELVWDLDEAHYHSLDLDLHLELVRAWRATLAAQAGAAPISTRERYLVEIRTRASIE
jgi:hypothetical protein